MYYPLHPPHTQVHVCVCEKYLHVTNLQPDRVRVCYICHATSSFRMTVDTPRRALLSVSDWRRKLTLVGLEIPSMNKASLLAHT